MAERVEPGDWAVIVACNNRDTLEQCLMRSPDIASGAVPVVVVEGASCMGEAYNRGLERTDRPVCAFAHQDVYLPRGWLERASRSLSELTRLHPDWEVAGPIGAAAGGDEGPLHGRVFDTSYGSEFRTRSAEPPIPAEALDELLLILRRRPGYRFDERLPHFHLYGTDMVQSALAAGRGAYVVDMPVVHNARLVASLGGDYARAWYYARRKWWSRLPVRTSVSVLSRNPFHLWREQWRLRGRPARTDAPLPDVVEAARAAGYE